MPLDDIMQAQWIHKYRPFNFDDLVGQTIIKTVCKNVIRGEDELLNMLFRGPSGIGKSCAIDILCRSLFGDDLMKERVLQVSAFDERGINMIRDKIKFFATLKTGGNRVDNHLCPDLKVVVIDEIDNLTFDAQTALRNLIETSSRSTRFCMICTDELKVIEPIKSRCLLLPFVKLSSSLILNRIINISEQEHLDFNKDVLLSVARLADGDMRKAVNTLQAISCSEGLSCTELLCDISGCENNLIDCADKLYAAEHFLKLGGDPHQLLEKLSQLVLYHPKTAAKTTKLLCNIHVSLVNGCDEAISIAHALSVMPSQTREDNMSSSYTPS